VAWVTLLEMGGSEDGPEELRVPLDVDNDVEVMLVASGLTSALEGVTSLKVAEYGAGFPTKYPDTVAGLLLDNPKVVPVVSLITVKPEPNGRLGVSGTTSVAVVDSNPLVDKFPGAVEVANEEELVAARVETTELEAGALGNDVFADGLLLAVTDGMLFTSKEVGEAAAASEVELAYTPRVTELSDGKPVDAPES
ncbi:hypothetical protein KC324_g21232, partial [Hortaea werneckii]